MTVSNLAGSLNDIPERVWSLHEQSQLLSGEVVLQSRTHSAWGAGVQAAMCLPLTRSQVWRQLTDYPRWVHYFPDVTHSEILHLEPLHSPPKSAPWKRLYQAASKAILCFNVQVEVYLLVREVLHQQIQFRLEKGSFLEFDANLTLQDWRGQTLLNYAVQATPNIPVPGMLMQQVMHWDFPTNLKQMRRVLCQP